MLNRRATLGTFGALCFSGVSSPVFSQTDIQALYEEAKKEGKVVYWGSPDAQTARLLVEHFKRRYPGIEVDVFKIQSAPAIERVILGARSGRPEADVVDSVLAYLPLLFERNLVVSHPWAENFGIDPNRVLFDGRALTLWHLDSPISVNTQKVKPAEIKTWEDLLDAKWRGKLVVEARGFTFAILALKWGENRAFEYLKSILASRPIITKGGTATVEALSGGQGSVALGAYAGIIEQYKTGGAPIDWLRIGPVPTAYAVLLQLSNAPHPNAARLWSYFMTTRDAHDAIYKGMGLDIVFGRDVGDLGKKYVAANLEVLPETTDVNLMQNLVAQATSLIGSFK